MFLGLNLPDGRIVIILLLGEICLQVSFLGMKSIKLLKGIERLFHVKNIQFMICAVSTGDPDLNAILAITWSFNKYIVIYLHSGVFWLVWKQFESKRKRLSSCKFLISLGLSRHFVNRKRVLHLKFLLLLTINFEEREEKTLFSSGGH